MGSLERGKMNGHAVCIPFPAQGHINPMLKLAKLLHSRGFHITFVNTHFNRRRLLRSRGPRSLDGLPDFRFAAIPDGLPLSDTDATQDISSLCASTPVHSLHPFRCLLSDLAASSDVPPVSCIVSDGAMSFTLDAAREFGIPEVLFWTPSACGFLGYTQYKALLQRALVPLKDWSCLTNGYLETKIDWMPGMMKNACLKDIPSFIRTTDPDDVMIKFLVTETERSSKASAIIINTFDSLERDAIDALSAMFPAPVFTIGPLHLMLNTHIKDNHQLKSIGSNLWKEDRGCMEWLDSKEPNSVVYVNFGSIAVMTSQQLVEMAWGLANSKKDFLWIIRPDLVTGNSAVLPPEFLEETRGKGKLASWCPQEEVLSHWAVAGFLTHSGWNSTLESLGAGVPMICWPFFAEQPTNCRYSCEEWGVGMEIASDVNREEVERVVRELMDGEKGKEMKRKTAEWKKKAEAAVAPGGSSDVNLETLFSRMQDLSFDP
ncbi:7-deoxyloganetin glucosyltransferase-like isoform X4 [Diospyros lotus]|nr:7-deoxyloganetin glucosyltransferase-like isoform X4 [Diospyros lotus]XP_052193386.1 7-deoxyloganetin glucosyltransferase-like isoform X4 [Diospyros lotus]